MPLASIPSPGRAVWHLGPLSVRAYALCVIAGIVVAVAVAGGGYGRARAGVRPGRGEPGQLVGPAVLRPAVGVVVGGADLARAPGAWLRELRHLPARLPVPVAVGGCPGLRGDLGGQEVRPQ